MYINTNKIKLQILVSKILLTAVLTCFLLTFPDYPIYESVVASCSLVQGLTDQTSAERASFTLTLKYFLSSCIA